jgi:tetratricopeptide (TPR) repeat protein
MLKRLLALCLILFGFQAYLLWGKEPSNQERYAYRYIVLLYEKGQHQVLAAEIDNFRAEYPQSEYSAYVRFLGANLKLEKGAFAAALEDYDALLFENLDLAVKQQLQLNRALSLYHLKDYAAAMTQLQVLESSSKDPRILAEVYIQKARIYSALSQYFSAMRSYQYALGRQRTPEILYEYMQVLLGQHKVDEAEEVLQELAGNDSYFVPAHITYLEYLLNSGLLADFEALLAEHPSLKDELETQILILRKAFLDEDYARAEAILSQSSEHEYFTYYRALLATQQGKANQADSLFADLVRSGSPELRILSYLQRLKILYQNEPVAAMLQLGQFVQNPDNRIAKAEQYLTLGFFAYQKADYLEALKQFNLARSESLNPMKLAEIDIYIAKSWLKAKRNDSALQAFNRYLNLYPQGRDRDAALFYLGFIHHEKKDYPLAKSAFTQLIATHPNSAHVPPAKFYLAEMDYYLANYNLALMAFLDILQAEPENSDAALRVAQIYYYMENYDEAERWLEKISPGYDSLILQGHVNFIKRDYNMALQFFSLSERSTSNPLRITEAQSYRALCLYQMKRYQEATELYLKLFKGSESPDTYLYLGAKSAYAAGDYHQALRLYDQFVDTYPSSQYFLPVLADIANSYYNMGNYAQAVQDYKNILSRYRNIREFSDADRALLGEVFTGLELSLKRADDQDLISDLAALSETFQSLYISFELSYLIIRLYAESELWDDVLVGAEELRSQFPQVKRNEVEMLMAESLIRLEEYSVADSLLASLYQDTQDLEALTRWAEIDYLSENYAAALQKYRQAYATHPSSEMWFNMLKASISAEYQDFDALWSMGSHYQDEIPSARLFRLEYLVSYAEFAQALELTDSIINESLSSHDHAMAFLYKGIIAFTQVRYEAAITEFNRTIMLFPDMNDIQDLAFFYLIRSYLELGERSEAELILWDAGSKLSDEHLSIINSLMEDAR